MVLAKQVYYKDACKASTTVLKACFTGPDGNFKPPSTVACIQPLQSEMTVHYSFDFAQQVKVYQHTTGSHYSCFQVHYPSNPLQPGPIYFLTPRKCGLFGICCEGMPKQVNKISTRMISNCIHYTDELPY